jgi:hypothetical protein
MGRTRKSARKHASADDRIRPAGPHVADDRVGDIWIAGPALVIATANDRIRPP